MCLVIDDAAYNLYQTSDCAQDIDKCEHAQSPLHMRFTLVFWLFMLVDQRAAMVFYCRYIKCNATDPLRYLFYEILAICRMYSVSAVKVL